MLKGYSDRALAIGSVFGTRFMFVQDGMPTAVNGNYSYSLGENVAYCKVESETRQLAEKFPNFDIIIKTCQGFISKECTCGFYACFDHKELIEMFNYELNALSIKAIVEGYGKVVIGEKGFRAEKIRIAALYLTDDYSFVEMENPTENTAVFINLAGSEFAITSFCLYCPGSCAGIKHYNVVPKEITMSGPIGPVPQKMLDAYNTSLTYMNKVSKEIAQKYNVPCFDSYQAAIAEFPLTNPKEFTDN